MWAGDPAFRLPIMPGGSKQIGVRVHGGDEAARERASALVRAGDLQLAGSDDGEVDVVLVLVGTERPDAGVRAAKSRFPEAGIVVLAGVNDPVFAPQAIQSGAQGYVLEGSPAERVQAALRAVAGGGSFVQPSIGGALARNRSTEPIEEPEGGADA